jgi:hypothetical protein
MVEIRKFYYRLFIVDESNTPIKFLGNAFPITPNGGLLTCRHVVQVNLSENHKMAVYDNEENRITLLSESDILYDGNSNMDLAYIQNALQRKKEEYIPILTPNKVIIGTDIYSYGYFMSGKNLEQGFFSGTIVNIFREGSAYSIRLPFAVLEGMSGSPIATYHNGMKLIGIGYGNRASRILASEVLEYRDDKINYTEKIHRIVEFGIAYHAETIIEFLNRINIKDYMVSDQRLKISDE